MIEIMQRHKRSAHLRSVLFHPTKTEGLAHESKLDYSNVMNPVVLRFLLQAAVPALFTAWVGPKLSNTGSLNLWDLTIIALILISFVILGRFVKKAELMTRNVNGIKISGMWDSVWIYRNSSDEIVKIKDTIEIKQIGGFFWGEGKSTSVSEKSPFSSFKYNVSGEVDRNFLIRGDWKNSNKARVFDGSFKLKINPDGQCIEGAWLGNSSSDKINYGVWRWTRIDR